MAAFCLLFLWGTMTTIQCTYDRLCSDYRGVWLIVVRSQSPFSKEYNSVGSACLWLILECRNGAKGTVQSPLGIFLLYLTCDITSSKSALTFPLCSFFWDMCQLCPLKSLWGQRLFILPESAIFTRATLSAYFAGCKVYCNSSASASCPWIDATVDG